MLLLSILECTDPDNISPEVTAAPRATADTTVRRSIIQNDVRRKESGTRKKIYSVSFQVSLAGLL